MKVTITNHPTKYIIDLQPENTEEAIALAAIKSKMDELKASFTIETEIYSMTATIEVEKCHLSKE